MTILHMVPAFASAGGRDFSRALLPSLGALAENLVDATRFHSDGPDGPRFHTDPQRLDGAAFERAAVAVGRGRKNLTDLRRGDGILTKYEYEFFRFALKISHETIDALATLAAQGGKTKNRPWISAESGASPRAKTCVTFNHHSPEAVFFGLDLPRAVDAALLAGGLTMATLYEKDAVDFVGLGVPTALNVYERRVRLGSAKNGFLPHKTYRVEDVSPTGAREPRSARFFVAARYLPVIYR